MLRILALAGLLAGLTAPAFATAYTATLAPFSAGGSLTLTLDGTDTNSDGLITGYLSSSPVPFPNEVSSLGLVFSGNPIFPAFTASTTDFTSDFTTGGTQTLDFAAFGSFLPGDYRLIYVADAALAETSSILAGLFPLTTGDLAIQMFANVVTFDSSSTPTTVSVLDLIGATCGAFGTGKDGFYGGGVCTFLALQQILPDTLPATIDVVLVPEPMTIALFGTALFGLGAVRRRA
jgi:hypothetical protein